MPLADMTRRARNVVIANNDFVPKPGTVLTSPTVFVPGMGLSNMTNDRLSMVARTIGNSVILDLDMGYPVPASLFMLLGHNFTAAARWRIRGASARSGAAGDAGGYTFALADTVYDTRRTLASGTASGAYTWTSAMLDHDFTTGTLPAGASFSRASIGTYFDASGTLRTAAAGEPRYDYDPVTKAARGLLIEETRTNLLLNADALSTQSVTVTAQAYTLSFYGTGTVTLSGTSTAGPLVGAGVFPARTTLTFTPSAGTLTLTVTGTVQYAQLEAGAFPTSYIPTTATTVTRATDFLTLPASVLPSFSATAGTLLASFRMPFLGGPGYPGIAFLDDGGTNNYIGLFVADASSDQVSFEARAGGVVQVGIANATYVAGTTVTAGGAWAAANFALSVNGSTPTTSSSGTVPTVTTQRVGSLFANLFPLNGWVSRLTYIASRVSNADLQTLTDPATSAATRAATLAPYAGTSSTAPVTLMTGPQSVYVDDTGLRFYPGASVRLAIDAANYMRGTVTAYDRPSRKLTVNVTSVVGGGSASTVSILREATDLAVWPSVAPFGLSYWGDFSWGGQIDLLGEGYQPPGVHLPGLAYGDGQPVYARYIKIEVRDASLSWLDIGRLVVAAAYQPTINMSWDWRLSWVDPSTRERSRGGSLYVDARRQWRAASLQLANIGRNEMLSQMYELRRAVGVRKPFAVILDPTDAANLHRLTLWGSIPDPSFDIANPQFGAYGAALNLEESF